MKFFKKLLSGVMALTMAVSMALSTAVQVGAETQKDGSHKYEVTAINEMKAIFANGNLKFEKQMTITFGTFDSKEYESLKKESAKYDSSKGNYIKLSYTLQNKKKDIAYNFTYSFDKIFANSEQYTCKYSKGSKEHTTGFTRVLDINKEKYSFQLLFDIDSTVAKEVVQCDEAFGAITIVEGGTLKPFSLGNDKTDNSSLDLTIIDDDKRINKKYIAKDTDNGASDDINETTNDISKLSFSKISSQTYTGKECKPSVTVKDGKTKLTEGKDYTLTYKNNKKIGKATVTVKGKGDYTGEKTISFNIVPKKTTLKVSKKSDTKAAFSWTAVKGAEKYEIYYSKDNGKTYKKLTTVAGSKTSYTSSKLDFKKYDYKFKIRSYGTSSSKKYYSSYSKVVTVK